MLRRAGLLAALSALLVPAVAGTSHAATRSPVVKSVAPKQVFVGQTLTLRGKNFRRGLGKNTVAFKRRGAKAFFVRAGKATTKLLQVTIPKRLEKAMLVQNGMRMPTRLQVRVLAARFGKRFTSLSMSPVVGPERPLAPPRPAVVGPGGAPAQPRPPVVGPDGPPAQPQPPAANPDGDCDGDRVMNSVDADDDNDLLSDTLEQSLKLNSCSADTDGDRVEDGYEYQSARDLNDDEHQSPNTYLPYPGKRPYPNPLDGTDAGRDHDGDDLSLLEEYTLWKYAIEHGSPRTLERLTYSAGEQYSLSARAGGTGRRTPTQSAEGYDKQAEFQTWAAQHDYAKVALSDIGTNLGDPQANWWDERTEYDLLDANRDHNVSDDERYYYDFGSGERNGLLDDAERDEDADGLSNFAETHGAMNPGLWAKLFGGTETRPADLYSGTDLVDPDTDGDGVRDGADDQDFDDVPNLMESSRLLAAGIPGEPGSGRSLYEDPSDSTTPIAGLPASGLVDPFNPCAPHAKSRTCPRSFVDTPWAPYNSKDKLYLIKD